MSLQAALGRGLALFQFSLLMFSGPTKAACIDPAVLTHSTVSITKHFSAAEKKDPALLGIRGTAWFLSAQLMVTAAHVAQSMELSEGAWHEIEISDGRLAQAGFVLIRQLAGAGPEKIALLSLKTALPAVQPLPLRSEALTGGEPVVSLGYPGNHLRFASGRFVNPGNGGKLAGSLLFELSDGNDRLALDHGASGAPILDCDGRVAAVVSNIFAKTLPFMSQAIRISTAWGNPNIAAVPITVLGPEPRN